jgi:abhydrolase domain-containing protein 12
MYDFLKNNLHSSVKLYLWGHSLGTGVSSKVARILSDQNRPADGLVLEAPFYNIFEIVDLHPFTLVTDLIHFFNLFFFYIFKTLALPLQSDIV